LVRDRDAFHGAAIKIEPALSDVEKIDQAKRRKLGISSAEKELGYKPQFRLKKAIKGYVELFKNLS
jgi:nucleoside-diphosphate-sugar epimerase